MGASAPYAFEGDMWCDYRGRDKYGCPNCGGECGTVRSKLIQVGEVLYGPRFQRELAEALGVNERTMRRWVAGDFAPPASLQVDLVRLLRERRDIINALVRALG